jgi:hypothetical protein
MATAATPCTSCGKPITGADILYTEDANPICMQCNGVRSIHVDEERAARNIQKAAWTCLVTAIIGYFINPFFIMNVFAMLSGIWAIQSMARGNERFTNYLSSGERGQIWVCSILGIALTALQVLAIVFAIGVVMIYPIIR